mmetsp:Transcript_1396/g.2942  ORF Transcript_1396/g.2942 Transcript_1396/m.2942 type:complete len:373 (-) Transcript_1396:448-1566(-)
MSHLDLGRLLEDSIITNDTYEWLKPLHEQEEADLEEIRLAAEARKNDPFAQCRTLDDDEDDDDILTTTTKTLRNIEGTDTIVTFVTDTNSTGHGNKVWHSSIATCRYLLNTLSLFSMTKDDDSCRSLELGAGTAVPSLFLAAMQKQNHAQPKSSSPATICISDAKQYRNIHQILLSVGMQTTNSNSDNNTAVRFKVHPHNWGEFDKTIPGRKAADNAKSNKNGYDLVIVSDCIYNPEYHEALLESLAHTLNLGGRAVVSFSLHGNVDDELIWDFVEQQIPATAYPCCGQDNYDGNDKDDQGCWRLEARCVSTSNTAATGDNNNDNSQAFVHREGWNMEDTMKKLGLVTEGLAEERWFSYVYEITWVSDEEIE